MNSYASQDGAPWGLDRIDARSGLDNTFNYEFDGWGVDIFVLDTGVQDHQDYTGRFRGCTDYTGEGCDVSSPDPHGTHVAGTATGTTYGVAKASNLYGYKVLQSDGSGTYGGIISAIDDIIADKQRFDRPIVINMSLGGGYYVPMNEAVESATLEGIVVVVAAGNENTDACNSSPASAASAITVGAIDMNDNRASFSNYGACVDIWAPGTGKAWQNDTRGCLIGAPC